MGVDQLFHNRDPHICGDGNFDLPGRFGVALSGFDVDTRDGSYRGKLHFLPGKQGTILAEKAVCKGRVAEV